MGIKAAVGVGSVDRWWLMLTLGRGRITPRGTLYGGVAQW